MPGRMRRKRNPVLVVIVILTVLLPLLAYLQYQWLGKVSEREREQMMASLRRSLDQLRQDFDREIARIYLQFQSQPFASEVPAQEYAQLYRHWKATAPYPKLIRDIFLEEASMHDSVLKRLNASSGEWEAADWISEFGSIRHSGTIDGSSPAISIPRIAFGGIRVHQVIDEPARETISSVPEQFATVIVRLDLQYIRDEFLPALVRSHFGESAPEYRIHITDVEEPSRVVYSTESGSKPPPEADTTQNIFSIRLPEYRNLVPAGLPYHAAIAVPPGAAVQTFDMRVIHGIGTTMAVLGETAPQDPGVWRIAATHRSGSLDIAVGQIRRRNLAMSFSILALLAASIGIVLVSAQRERRLARQQMEFVSTVSHELRTPLAIICSAGENLADGVVRDSEQLRSYGKLVRNEGRRLSDMVEQVLTFAGMESGLKKYKLAPTAVPPLIDAAIACFEVPLREADFTVERHVQDELVVTAHAESMGRALQNLISNAIKYSGAGRWIGISAENHGDGVCISVRDRGTGISSVDLPHIFEPFYRGRTAMDGQIQGSGLGLSLVKQIVEAHDGTIEASANAEGGSTFTIILPA